MSTDGVRCKKIHSELSMSGSVVVNILRCFDVLCKDVQHTSLPHANHFNDLQIQPTATTGSLSAASLLQLHADDGNNNLRTPLLANLDDDIYNGDFKENDPDKIIFNDDDEHPSVASGIHQ